MATKPVTLPNLWASAGIYATGPFIGAVSVDDPGFGIADEGHRPGATWPTAAEHENYQQLSLTTWVRTWLALGSSAPGADAHIVETDATGRGSVLAFDIVDPNDEIAFNVTSSNTFVPGSQFTCTTGATAVQAAIGNSTGVGFAVPIGTGAGTGFFASLASSAFGAFGVDVSADATTAGTCIRAVHDGVGYAIEAISTGALHALNVTATTAAASAASIVGGLTRALMATSSSSAGADAIHGILANNTGKAIRAYLTAGATSAARGFYCLATGSGVAAEFSAPANHALIITGDVTTPTYGALKITECDTVPSSPIDEQVAIVRSSFGVAPQLMHSSFLDFPTTNGWRGILSTRGGSAFAAAYNAGPTFNNVINSWATAVTINSLGGDCPKTAGRQVLMRISMSVRQGIAATSLTLNLRIVDVTDFNTIVWTRSGAGAGAGSGYTFPTFATTNWHPPISIIVPVTVPADGNRQWRLEFGSSSTDVHIRDISVDFLGMT